MNTPHDPLKSLQSLLRMKKLETPGKAYFDHFPEAFRRYQRSVILEKRPSLLQLFQDWREKVAAHLTPSYSYGVAFTCFALLALVGYSQISQPSASVLAWQAARTGQVMEINRNVAPVGYAETYRQQPQPPAKQAGLLPQDAPLSF